MPVSSSGVVTAARPLNTLDGQVSGVVRQSDFAVCGDVNSGTQLQFSVSSVSAGTAVVLTAPAVSGTLAISGVSGGLQYATPTTGQTVALASTTTNLIVNPAGTLDALTITLPAASDGKKFTASSSEIVTALTITAAGSDTVKNTVTSLAAGGAFTFVARSTVWYRG